MALTGIQIYKLLPKTNCGECGVPTCLAFAMSLAAAKAELVACPYVSEEVKAELEENDTSDFDIGRELTSIENEVQKITDYIDDQS